MSLPGQALVTDPTVMTTVAIFGLAVDSTPLASTKVYTARIAVPLLHRGEYGRCHRVGQTRRRSGSFWLSAR